jgi:hypothetical protein
MDETFYRPSPSRSALCAIVIVGGEWNKLRGWSAGRKRIGYVTVPSGVDVDEGHRTPGPWAVVMRR